MSFLSQENGRKLATTGVIVELEVRHWFLEWEVAPSCLMNSIEEQPKIYAPVRKALYESLRMPELHSIEEKARKHLRDSSIRTSFGNYMPLARFASWRNDHEKLRDEFVGVQSELFLNFEEVRRKLTEVLREQYRLQLQAPIPSAEVLLDENAYRERTHQWWVTTTPLPWLGWPQLDQDLLALAIAKTPLGENRLAQDVCESFGDSIKHQALRLLEHVAVENPSLNRLTMIENACRRLESYLGINPFNDAYLQECKFGFKKEEPDLTLTAIQTNAQNLLNHINSHYSGGI
jgi:hypothetical protein